MPLRAKLDETRPYHEGLPDIRTRVLKKVTGPLGLSFRTL
jgi:hypothetical protein